MRTRIRRRFRAALAVIMAVCMLCAIPLAANAEVYFSGTVDGTNTRWELFDDNVLVLSCQDSNSTAQTGNFALQTFPETNAPWAQFYPYTGQKFMQKIVLANGITSIGDYCFYMKENNNYNVNLINLCDSLVTIGAYAFANEKVIQSIAIPQNVTSIGVHAFDGTSSLNTVNCFANPADLKWDIGASGLADDCEIHVMSKYLDTYKAKFTTYADRFFGDLSEPTNSVPKGKNILISYEEVSGSIFGGALPYSIKAVNTKGTWPITYGARGFVTCIEDNGSYYALTDNNSGTLSLLGIDSTSGKALHTLTDSQSQYQKATVKLSHEYIGANSVKVIYNVKNLTNEKKVFTLGSSGDIKIGLDDKATITPLSIDGEEIGITMTSTNSKDKIDEKSPTLGFAGKKVGGSAGDSTYFYGKVGANKTQTATAVKSDIFIPERIFSMNSSSSYQSLTTGNLSGEDSGLSFYWDVSLEPNEEKQYAVIFSVPNTESGHANDTVIEEVKSNFSTNTDGFYTAGNKTIFFNNEVTPGSDDTLADKNNYDTLKNFLLLGVQKKISEHDGGSSLRYVTVVNTDILKDADEYGYIIAQTSKPKSEITTQMIAGIEYNNTKIYKKDIKGSSNTISGDYGKYNSDTHYKYVTLGIDDIYDESKTLVVRFYVKKDDKISYAKYFNTKGEELDGCAASYNDVINAANAQGGNG